MAVARGRTRIVLASSLALFIGVACGIDAVGTAPIPGEDASSSGGSSSGTGSSGTASSSGSEGDATLDAPPPCTPTGPEVCEDGVDNDCNGKTDCEDTACAQYACAKPETDWTFVSVRAVDADAGVAADAGDAGGACAAGWTNGRTMRDNVRAAAAVCGCACGAANGNPCANGTRDVSFRTGTTNCNDGTYNMNLDGTCQPLPFAWFSPNGADVQPPGSIVQVSCGATASLPPVVDDGALFVCDLAASGAPIACTNGACVLRPGADQICLLRAGEGNTCPAGYPTRKVVAAGYTDGRTCDACSCTTNATACSNRQMSFYTNAGCAQGQRTVVADSSCNDISGSGTPTHYRYEATPDGTCVAAAAAVGITGALTLTAGSTLCCPQ